jgi:hypothetical protein
MEPALFFQGPQQIGVFGQTAHNLANRFDFGLHG